ncbi:two-component system regulatory protein YycI [Sporosarcina sp. Marseille-Q4063]|uniref:two-component system regulatory protein YycI n=1 Tax=Sporosarcina sp. Marseille-Q4063 TaxID=2810514 RepID=UPI001BB098AB|nr:two-component system regulatory protein YycI [Sporosarcina sp. Marseille-Q4063]QUW20616.1 two-component system regulatory protein YycI [Sporosarcina sp. Marseille-Q4063]
MDWNKTKTILIVVFSILNVFLYSLYLDRYNDAQSLQVMGETSIEELLRLEDISYGELPVFPDESYYVSAEIAEFPEEKLKKFTDQKFTFIDEAHLISMLEVPYPLKDVKSEEQFTQFLASHVLNGKEYVLWNRDEEKRQATFFQKVEDYPIFFNKNAMLIIHWDEDENIISYEQSMFGEFINFNKKKDILLPIEAINTLYSKDYLRKGSTVMDISLGYSTHIQLTKTQVFAPTWHVRVKLEDEEVENYFVNATDGKVIEFKEELEEPEIDENVEDLEIDDQGDI